MQRVTVTLDEDLLAEIDRFGAARGYQNRSEALRDLARAGLDQREPEGGDDRKGVAAVIYVYDHHARELPKRLAQSFHDRPELSQAALHVHLDHDNCLEVTVLKGRMGDIRHIGEHIIAERGVRHGRVVTMLTDAPAKGARSARHHHPHPK